MIEGRIDHFRIESQALRSNRLGDPHIRDVYVYLPPGYDADPARRYPAILMLASHGNTAQGLLSWRPWGESLEQQTERLIASGACPPVMLVMPDTWTRLGGPLHVNSPAVGNYADLLLNEVIPQTKTRYRTARWGVMGHSSGGYGALYHAMTQPGLFAAVADHSGDAYFEYMALPGIAALHRNLARFGGLDGLMAEAGRQTAKDQAFWEAVSIVLWSATFAPNPAAPHGFDLPIDPETGALREEVWARCLPFDPVRMLRRPECIAALHGMREIYIDCGAYDEYNLQVGARLISKALREAGVAHTYEEYPGGHRGVSARYDVSIPHLARALEGI